MDVLKIWVVRGIAMLHIGDEKKGQSVRINAICRIYCKEETLCEIELDNGTRIEINNSYQIVRDALTVE